MLREERRGERRNEREDSGGRGRKRGREEHGERVERRDVIFLCQRVRSYNCAV
jgi:hypothetical protein